MHDLTAARIHALPALYHAAADLPTLADPGYEGAGIGILIPVNRPTSGRELDINTRTRNAIQRSLHGCSLDLRLRRHRSCCEFTMVQPNDLRSGWRRGAWL